MIYHFIVDEQILKSKNSRPKQLTQSFAVTTIARRAPSGRSPNHISEECAVVFCSHYVHQRVRIPHYVLHWVNEEYKVLLCSSILLFLLYSNVHGQCRCCQCQSLEFENKDRWGSQLASVAEEPHNLTTDGTVDLPL